MITQLLKGRLLTVINRTSHSIGAVGISIPPGRSKSIQLSKVQSNRTRGKDPDLDSAINNQHYMTELENLVKTGQAALSVDGIPLKWDVDAAYLDAPLDAPLDAVREVWNTLPAKDPHAIKTTFAALVAAHTYGPADFDGAVGPGTMVPPRNFTITGTTGVGEALASKSVVIYGLDIDNQIRTDTIVTTGLGASDTATDVGVIAFRQILSVVVPADATATGDYEFGFGNKIGLAHPLIVGGMLTQFTDNVVDADGVVVQSGTSGPNGTIALATDPNGVHNFIVMYVPN